MQNTEEKQKQNKTKNNEEVILFLQTIFVCKSNINPLYFATNTSWQLNPIGILEPLPLTCSYYSDLLPL